MNPPFSPPPQAAIGGVLRDGHRGGRWFRTCRLAASTTVGGAAAGGDWRHTGSGQELVLDPVVPQLGRDIFELVHLGLARLLFEGVRQVLQEEREEAGRAAAARSRSSNKMGGRRKKKKRRKKKVPKSSSSSLLPRAVGWMEHEDEGTVTTEYVQRADVHFSADVFNTLHADSMNSVHSLEVAGFFLVQERLLLAWKR